MPMCVVCFKTSASTPVGGTCSGCLTPPKPDYFQYRAKNLPQTVKRVMCISCGKDSGFNENTARNSCWGKFNGGQQCFSCHQRYKSGVSSWSMLCGGRDW